VIGDDLIELFAEQSNLYHRQNVDKWKMSPISWKWTDITKSEMKKFLGLILLMGQVRKDKFERLLVYRSYNSYSNIFTNNEQKSFRGNMASLAFQ
jgi:hypothetical protein